MPSHYPYHRLLTLLGLIFCCSISIAALAVPFSFEVVESQAASLTDDFGVVGAVPSLAEGQRQVAIDKIAELGVGWMRHEFDIDISNFEHYDSAHSKAKEKGIKTLGLLLFTGTDRGHEGWKSYVQKVVSHYGSDIPAWEIMNEADNYLTGSEYTSYLKEAHEIIKGINPGAIIVLTGITSRPETPNFWAAVAGAGGWGYFDVAGLHVYHSGYPEKVNFGGGDTSAEFDRAVAALSKNGGGKKIWITEMGYKISEVGNENQANYLARTMVLANANPTIQKIIVYRLADDNKGTYGLLGSDLSERPSYQSVKKVVSYLGGAGVGTKLYPASTQTLDSLESVTGWSTIQTSNGSTTLTTTAGKTGNGMKINYNLTADKAYAIAEKNITVAGKPEAFAAWFYGDDTKNVWKFRYKDAKGETFQTDLGNLASGWNYKQFILEKDDAWVSWDGDGVIDYPVAFNSFVVDRQGGEAAASGIVDELVAITGGADLYAYQFGSTIVYWKVNGSTTVELCGAKRDFSPAPNYATGVSCSDTPRTAAVTTSTVAKVSPTPKATAAKIPALPTTVTVIDKAKSIVRLDGTNILADGTSFYRIVMLFKDAAGNIVKTLKPILSLEAESATTKLSEPILIGDEWWVNVTSTSAGEKKVAITVGKTKLDSISLTFFPLPLPSPSPTPALAPVVSTISENKKSSTGWVVAGILVLLSISGGAIWYLKRHHKISFLS